MVALTEVLCFQRLQLLLVVSQVLHPEGKT